jgi:sugar phosphate isomerase/epimerase
MRLGREDKVRLGVLTLLFGEEPLEQTLDYLQTLGIEAVEFGSGAYVKCKHFATDKLLSDELQLRNLKNAIADRKMTISALSCHGNPLHPDPKIAQAHHDDFVKTCQLARKLDVHQVNTLSGCPGSDPKAERPSWIVSPLFAEDFLLALEWQWREQVVPYWLSACHIATENGVRIGVEMVPNCVVYNVETLQKLRNEVGETIGANLDPSHLFWQGADVRAVIRALGPAIYHFHAKDSAMNPYVTAVNGILDAKPLTDELNRSWIFRTVGYGHDQLYWNEIVSHLRMIGYDSTLSIEHEDSLMSGREGLSKAVSFLRTALIAEKPGTAYWAK